MKSIENLIYRLREQANIYDVRSKRHMADLLNEAADTLKILSEGSKETDSSINSDDMVKCCGNCRHFDVYRTSCFLHKPSYNTVMCACDKFVPWNTCDL